MNGCRRSTSSSGGKLDRASVEIALHRLPELTFPVEWPGLRALDSAPVIFRATVTDLDPKVSGTARWDQTAVVRAWMVPTEPRLASGTHQDV